MQAGELQPRRPCQAMLVPREHSYQETLHHSSLKSSACLTQVYKTKMLTSKSPFTVDMKVQVCVGAIVV